MLFAIFTIGVAAAPVSFQGQVERAGASYQVDPRQRVIFGTTLALEMHKRIASDIDMVRVTATLRASGELIYNRRFALSGQRHIVYIDGFDLGRSAIQLCVNSRKLAEQACYAIDVVRLE